MLQFMLKHPDLTKVIPQMYSTYTVLNHNHLWGRKKKVVIMYCISYAVVQFFILF